MAHRPAPSTSPQARTKRPVAVPTQEPAGATAQELAFAQRLIKAEAQAVEEVARRLGPEFHFAVDLLVRCADAGGTVLLTGLGKSGLIGQKISATLASLGIASHFVHPAEAAHGDLGRFRADDVCIALSYSGETDEVVNLAAILRQDNLPIISITRGNVAVTTAAPAPPATPADTSKAALERLATVALFIGPCQDAEVSPAPTCSTTAMLALGDALALCAARRRNFTDDDFAKRHPGGTLGGLLRPITEALRFVVGQTLKLVPDDINVGEALALSEIPNVRGPGAVLLVHRTTGKLTGIFTDGDVRRLIKRNRPALDGPIREVMTKNPASLPHTALLRDAVQMIRESRRDEIPVIDESGRPIGLLDVQDLVALKLIRSE